MSKIIMIHHHRSLLFLIFFFVTFAFGEWRIVFVNIKGTPIRIEGYLCCRLIAYPANIHLDEDVLKTSWGCLSSCSKRTYSSWLYVFKTSSRRLAKSSSRHLQDVFKTFWRRLQNVFKTSWKTSSRHLQDVFKTFWRRLQDIFKTSCKDIFKTFSRCIIKLNCSC